ncbi:MAG: XrtA system polysaccharide chain length determinant [Pseudomonadota bacterium]
MHSNVIEDRVKAVLRELHLRKTVICIVATIISLVVLVIGIFIPKQYETSAVLFADFKNVIKPLLENQTSMTEINQAQVAKKAIGTRRVMEEVAKTAGIITDDQSPFAQARILAQLREKVQIESKGSSYLEISFKHHSQDTSFQVVDELVRVFIRESAEAKRRESSEAFNFIEGQVKEYKKQLLLAEGKLKDFQIANKDGTRETVEAQISKLRADIEKLKLDIDDARTRKRSIARQLDAEGKYVARRHKSDEVRERLGDAKRRLDALLLTYTDTHPDVLSLQTQISEMESSLLENEVQGLSTLSSSNGKQSLVNPLYEELRKQFAEAEVDLKAADRRKNATERLLQEEYNRLERIVGRGTELQELSRDYDVTKKIYEDLLNKKEQARMSMTLDLAGQGVSYKVQAPAEYPLLPSGLRLVHFLFLGPIIGLLIPMGLLYVFIEIDPRIRIAGAIEEKLKLPLLAVIPHVNTPIKHRIIRPDVIPLIAMVLLVIVAYVSTAIYFLVS